MRSNLDTESGSKPDELPNDAKLEAGYIRYIRILPTEGPKGEICFETCIRRSQYDDDDDEKCTTQEFSYSAISYSWGVSTPSHSITVDGHERMVANNLWYFLQRVNSQCISLRHTKARRVELKRSEQANWMSTLFGSPTAYLHFEGRLKDFLRDLNSHDVSEQRNLLLRFLRLEGFNTNDQVRYLVCEDHIKAVIAQRGWSGHWLWIDALCIDQSDAQERTHQVGIMSEIFGRANQVVSWLGPAYDNSEHAMTTIAGYASEENNNVLPTLNHTDLSEAICSLCERPYWKRLWVFQELKHAKLIMLLCGDKSIFWNHFTQLWRAIVDIATTDEGRSDQLKQSLATRMMTLRSKPINFSLWNLLKETKNLECADRRDRVYALLSVATAGHEGIEADYNLDPLSLAHRVLHIKYAIRRPGALDDVVADCKFLEAAFQMTEDAMLLYRRHDAGGHNDSEVRLHWCQGEWDRMEMYSDWWGEYRRLMESKQQYEELSRVILSKDSRPRPPKASSPPSFSRSSSSHVDTGSPRAALSWSEWARFHNYTAVITLAQDGK
jgi:hypothetical protein